MDSRIREALERIANECDIGEHTEIARRALLAAEPEPCEDARKVAAQVSAVFGVSRPQVSGDPGNDPALDRATEGIAAYASQVADKREEELRAQVETLRGAFDNVQEVLYGTELNIGNYGDDDVCKLNGAAIQVWDIAEKALAATEPKP